MGLSWKYGYKGSDYQKDIAVNLAAGIYLLYLKGDDIEWTREIITLLIQKLFGLKVLLYCFFGMVWKYIDSSNQNEEDVSFYILFFTLLFFFKMKSEDFFCWNTVSCWLFNTNGIESQLTFLFPETDWSSSRKTQYITRAVLFHMYAPYYIVYEIFIEHEENFLVYCPS